MTREIKERKNNKLFSIVQGLSTNECHIGYEGRTVMGWHFLRDYLHFNLKASHALLIWSELHRNTSWVGKFQRVRILSAYD